VAFAFRWVHRDIHYLGRAITIFRQNAAHIRALEGHQHEEQRKSAQIRKVEMHALALDFETSVKLIASRLTQAAEKMNASSIALATSAGDTRDQSVTMSRIVETTSANVQTVASAAQQMSGDGNLPSQTIPPHPATRARCHAEGLAPGYLLPPR
jgi:methyl-accepting chemotaxis protein